MIAILIVITFISILQSIWSIANKKKFQEEQLNLQRRQYKTFPSIPPADTDPLKHYAILVDAGSSGSRVYIYWYHVPSADGPRKALELPVIDFVKTKDNQIASLKVEPGLSTFNKNLNKTLDDYIKKLLDFASSYVPEEKRNITALHILETVCLVF